MLMIVLGEGRGAWLYAITTQTRRGLSLTQSMILSSAKVKIRLIAGSYWTRMVDHVAYMERFNSKSGTG
jgi:hypothetical protein